MAKHYIYLPSTGTPGHPWPQVPQCPVTCTPEECNFVEHHIPVLPDLHSLYSLSLCLNGNIQGRFGVFPPFVMHTTEPK